MKIVKPSELRAKGGLFLFYGATGVGKTVLLCSASEIAPTLIISTEPRGVVVATDFGYSPDVVEVKSTKEADEVLRFLIEGKHNYKFVGLDTITEFQLVLGDEVLKEGVKSSLESNRKVTHHPDVMELRDWGIVLVRLWRFIRNLQSISNDIVIIATAQLAEAQDPKDKSGVVYSPFLRGQWRTLIGAYFDLVAYMDTEYIKEGKEVKVNRLLYTQPLGSYIAKSRYILPPVIENPTMKKILELIRGSELISKAEKAIKELYG